jgi:hypothetical protein
MSSRPVGRTWTLAIACAAAGAVGLTQQAIAQATRPVAGPRVMETLGRGLVAVPTSPQTVFLSWRLLGTDPDGIAFNLYRRTGDAAAVKLNPQPLTAGTNFLDASASLESPSVYEVRAVIDGREEPAGGTFSLPAGAAVRSHLEIPLKPRPNAYVHMAWVGDLDGDGEYDYVVDRLPIEGDAHRHLEAYRRDGTFLWAIDYGPQSLNPTGVRWNAGAATISHGHNDNVTVFDLDLDGRAEVITVSAKGVVFGDGRTLDEGDDVQQFISVVDGRSGAERARAPVPSDFHADGPVAGHMGIMSLDGVRPSVVFKAKNRRPSGPFNLMTNAWAFDGRSLVHRWKWVRSEDVADFHQIRIVDVDGDGRDELCDGGFVLDAEGKLLYRIEGVVHGDRFHIGDLDPDRPGLEGFGVQQNNPSRLHLYYYDAKTGEVLRRHEGPEPADVGRGIAADVDPAHRGYEYWGFSGIFNAATGEKLSDEHPWPNFRIWWDGDVLSENLNRTMVEKWDPATSKPRRLLNAHDVGAVRTWRDAPLFYGDLLGDWREEVIFEHADRDRLLIFTTTIPSDVRLYTLPHNPAYRAAMTVKGYKQSHMVDYYLGHGMTAPPKPNIVTTPPKR